MFKECQEHEKLPSKTLIQDVATRWNSSYLMLERFNEQKAAVELFCFKKKVTCLNSEEWMHVEILIKILGLIFLIIYYILIFK